MKNLPFLFPFSILFVKSFPCAFCIFPLFLTHSQQHTVSYSSKQTLTLVCACLACLGIYVASLRIPLVRHIYKPATPMAPAHQSNPPRNVDSLTLGRQQTHRAVSRIFAVCGAEHTQTINIVVVVVANGSLAESVFKVVFLVMIVLTVPYIYLKCIQCVVEQNDLKGN